MRGQRRFQVEIRPVAHIYTAFEEKFGIPRQSGRAPSLAGRIVFEPEFRSPEALRGIEQFSHLWVIFDFSEAHRDGWSPTVRPPRLGGNMRVGVFASRSPFRPNSLGLSSVRLVGVEHSEREGDVLLVEGVDMLNGTPVYDIKPYLPGADSHPDARGGYADEFAGHRLEVELPPALAEKIPGNIRAAVVECIADDPRPSYQSDANRVYGMRFSGLDIRFTVGGGRATVVAVERMDEGASD